MAYNSMNPGKTNDWNIAGATPPPGMLPVGPQGATLQNVQGWGNPDVQAQTNPLGTNPTTSGGNALGNIMTDNTAAAAKFMRPGNPAATPPPATNPNTLMSGTMTLPGAPGAVAGIGPEGARGVVAMDHAAAIAWLVSDDFAVRDEILITA